MSRTDPPPQAVPAAKPSLLTPMKPGGAQPDGLRMLHGLGVAPTASSRSTPAWRWWMAAAGLLGLGLMAFAWRQALPQSIPKPPPLASKVGGDEVATVQPLAAVSAAAPTASAETPVMGGRGALLESPAAQAQPESALPVPVPAMPASAALSASAPAVAQRPEPKTQLVQRNPAHAARPAAPAATPPAARPPAVRAPAMPEAGRDPDVDLVAALMAHVAGGPAPAPKGGAVAGAPKPVAAAPAAAQATIDPRVQRCKASQPDDREASRACRRRVCDGHWGRYPACPVRLMPRAATTA